MSPLLPADGLSICMPFDFGCAANNAATIVGGVGKAASNTVLKSWSDAVFESLTDTLVRIGTFWVKVGTPSVTSPASEVAFIQNHLAFLTVAAVTISAIAAGIQLAAGRTGAPMHELVKAFATYLVVAGAGAVGAGYLIHIADAFSQWILEQATGDDGTQFAFSLFQGGLVAGAYTGSLGPILVILLGLFGIIANVIQIGMMMLRSAFLVILIGILPISASMTNTTWGKSWFNKNITWLVAFLLYKPAASIVYAVAIKLTSRRGFVDQWSSDDVTTFIMGILLLVAAVFVLPALIGFVVPASAAMSQGGPGVGDSVVMGAMATGSIMSMHSAHSSSTHSGGPGAAAPGRAEGSGTSAAGGDRSAPDIAPASAGSSSAAGPGAAGAGATSAGAGAGAGASAGASAGAAVGATAATGGLAAPVIVGAQLVAGASNAIGSAASDAASAPASGASTVVKE